MSRFFLPLAGVGLLLALFFVIQATADEPRTEPEDPGFCAADVDLPLRVELEAPAIASPGSEVRAVCRVTPRRAAERIELALRPSSGVVLAGSMTRDESLIAGGDETPFELMAVWDGSQPRGTVDVLVTAWIDGLPYERGATWNLISELPPTGRVVPRAGQLPVREQPVGRKTR